MSDTRVSVSNVAAHGIAQLLDLDVSRVLTQSDISFVMLLLRLQERQRAAQPLCGTPAAPALDRGRCVQPGSPPTATATAANLIIRSPRRSGLRRCSSGRPCMNFFNVMDCLSGTPGAVQGPTPTPSYQGSGCPYAAMKGNMCSGLAMD